MNHRVSAACCLFPLALIGCGDDTGSGGSGAGSPGEGCEPSIGCPTVESACVAYADNAGAQTFNLRISHLTVEAPVALTDPTVKNLLSKGVTLDDTACQSADALALFTGDGTFNWILQLDLAAGTLKTGGAALQTDPSAPYCFLNGDIAGFDVAPLEAPISVTGNSFEIDEVRDVAVPVFTDKNDPSKVILLPLRGVRIFDTTFSDDHNCIGTFNGSGLDPNNLCLPDNDNPQFVDGGKLEGYVTLEEADDVDVPELGNASLCALIAGADFVDQATNKCRRDGAMAIEFQGDWCAGAMEGDPGQAASGTCADAVKLTASFAASGAAVSGDCP